MRFSVCFFFFSSRRRHTRWPRDWSSDVCSSDLSRGLLLAGRDGAAHRGPPALSLVAGSHSAEIGRASCRERVEIWEDAESLKKKIECESVAAERPEKLGSGQTGMTLGQRRAHLR